MLLGQTPWALRNLVLAVLFAMLAVLAVVLWYSLGNRQTVAVNSFEKCVELGYPMLESYPPECRTPDGHTFTEDIGNELEKQDLIRINHPRPNQIVKSPLLITGEARGYWFFEADFPAELLDANGTELGVAILRAEDEWATEDFVGFRGMLTFRQTDSEKGVLILYKHNASGLPEDSDQLLVPVRFREISH